MLNNNFYKKFSIYFSISIILISGSWCFCKAQPYSKDITVKKNITYATVDNMDLALDLYITPKAEAPMPLVVFIHGGAWEAGSKDFCLALPLLNHGFAVASINYRLTDVGIFPAQIYDCKAAIRYLRANADQYGIDPDHIGVWGDSAGGHLVALLGTTNGNKELEGTVGEHLDTSSDVQAVCDWYGPSELLSMPNDPESNKIFKNGTSPMDRLLGGTLSEKKHVAELASPLTHVNKDAVPFLIMHGDKDNIVPLKQSQLLNDKLNESGCDVKLIVVKGGGHGFWGIEGVNDPVIEFFQRTLSKSDSVAGFKTDIIETDAGKMAITFIGHGTLMIKYHEKIFHIDPWSRLADYSKLPKADVILITHEHADHLDPKAVEQARQDNCRIIMTDSCKAKIADGILMKNGDSRPLYEGITVKAVPAYNIISKRSDGEPYHPKGRGNGYILDFDGTKVYIAGDTEIIPEMKTLQGVDIAFLPMNQPYTMTPEMVADAAKSFKPKMLYPYHYGKTDVNGLLKLLEDRKDIEVMVRKLN